MEPFNVNDLVQRYLAGESISELHRSTGRDTAAIRKRLVKAGVKLRTVSEAQSLKWARMDTAAKRKHADNTRAAVSEMWAGLDNDARSERNRNSVAALSTCDRQLTAADRDTIARSREVHLSEVGEGEEDLIRALAAIGIDAGPQKAIGSYNLDVALKEALVAVEIDTGNFYRKTASGGRAVAKRLKYLLDRDWCVLFVIWTTRTNRRSGTAYNLNLPVIADQVRRLLDLSRRNKSVFGQYGVINRHGETVTGARSYLDGISRIPDL